MTNDHDHDDHGHETMEITFVDRTDRPINLGTRVADVHLMIIILLNPLDTFFFAYRRTRVVILSIQDPGKYSGKLDILCYSASQ